MPVSEDLASAGSARGQGDVESISDALEGEDATAAVSLLLCHALQSDPKMSSWSAVEDLPNFVAASRTLLNGTFDGAPWPKMRVSPDLIYGIEFARFVELVSETSKDCAADGIEASQVLVTAVDMIAKKSALDPRLQIFFERIRKCTIGYKGSAPSSPKTPMKASKMNSSNQSWEARETDTVRRSLPNRQAMQEASPEHTHDFPEVGQAGSDEEGEYEDDADQVDISAKDAGINVKSLDLLTVESALIHDAQQAWAHFIQNSRSKEAAGELIYGALFESAPSLQSLFTTPRAVQAQRFMNGLNSFIAAMEDPARLKILVETLGFGHLHLDVTVPRVVIFRDAILDLLANDLGAAFSVNAYETWKALLNYVGGAIIFCKAYYADRVKSLLESWRIANENTAENQKKNGAIKALEAAEEKSDDGKEDTSNDAGNLENVVQEEEDAPKKKERCWKRLLGRRGTSASALMDQVDKLKGDDHSDENGMGDRYVPRTFSEMFEWNAGIVGLTNLSWHREVLSSFDNIVKNVANSARLQEECEVLTIRITKAAKGTVNLREFQSCMLSALRSLLPKLWDSSYEVCWTWLWENVERKINAIIAQPPMWEVALVAFVGTLDENALYELRKQIYERFFRLCPVGQDFFKQSNTRLHFIAQRVISMTQEMYQDPWNMVEEISSLGLRHVGYGIPTEHIAPFVTACCQCLDTIVEDRDVKEGFAWSLGLISKILVRTIIEGSTIVMKAVNANSDVMLKKAIVCAPRGSRAEWVLNIQVGNQKISPLMWAIESGKLEAAEAIIVDLLTIRADREKYYYGVQDIFFRHEDIVTCMVEDAHELLMPLFDHLIWRSRHNRDGLRRVNYYVQSLIVKNDGGIADAMRSLTSSKDQGIISHPVICLVSDTLWAGVVRRQFIMSKIGFLFSLFVFMCSQAILPKINTSAEIRWSIFVGRMVNYGFSMTRLIMFHSRRWWVSYRDGKLMKVKCMRVPNYLGDFFKLLGFVLMCLMVVMCATEPMFWCASDPGFPTEYCEAAEAPDFYYIFASMLAMFLHWLLLIDMTVFVTKLSAFVLVVKHVLSEVGRFCIAMLFLLVAFGSMIVCLEHGKQEFVDLYAAMNCLFAITVGLYEGDFREYTDSPLLLAAIFMFVTASVIVLTNLLIAQLNCSYEYVYADMVGFARLTRATLIADMLPSYPPARWARFVAGLRFEQPVEFDEGDIGLAGAIQVKEPASMNPVMVDSINRFGGTCSPEMPWPAVGQDESADRLEKVERTLAQALAKLNRVNVGGRKARSQTQHGLSNQTGSEEETGSGGGSE